MQIQVVQLLLLQVLGPYHLQSEILTLALDMSAAAAYATRPAQQSPLLLYTSPCVSMLGVLALSHQPVQVHEGANLPLAKHEILFAQHRVKCLGDGP